MACGGARRTAFSGEGEGGCTISSSTWIEAKQSSLSRRMFGTERRFRQAAAARPDCYKQTEIVKSPNTYTVKIAIDELTRTDR